VPHRSAAPLPLPALLLRTHCTAAPPAQPRRPRRHLAIVLSERGVL
jgi:hypothetical protein